MCGMFTQGVALGYVVLPLQGVPLASFDTSSFYTFGWQMPLTGW